MDLLQRSVPVVGLTTAHSKAIIGFATTCFVLATVAVLLRVYARRLKGKSLVTEDYLVFLALVRRVQHCYRCLSIMLAIASISRPNYHGLFWSASVLLK